MSLSRLIVAAAGLCAVAIAAPTFAPHLLTKAVDVPTLAPPAPAPDARRTADLEQPSYRKVALRADRLGHFQADATVNGRAVPVIVDTGATTVALTEDSARRLGIALQRSDYTLPISTANGVIPAAPVMLSEVRIGGVSVRNVQAVVVSGDALPVNLLGMTFLSRLTKFEIGGGQLVLTQ